MICPKCNVFEFHNFCPKCGTPKTEFLKHTCECGKELGFYDNFCPQCGKAAPSKPIAVTTAVQAQPAA